MSAGKEGRQVRYFKVDEAKLEEVLSLSRFREAGLHLDKAEIIGSDVRFHVLWRGVGEGWFRIVEGRDDARFCASTHVCVLYEGREVSRAFALLMRKVARALSGLTIDDLLALLGPPPLEAAVPEDQPTPIHQWCMADGWYRFLCDHAVQRKFFETFAFEGASIYLMHGDLECLFITPHSGINLPRFFNYPWALCAEGNFGGGSLITDLDDLTVIQGGQQRLEECLRKAIERIGDQGPILVNSTCVPIVIGDDIDGIIAAHQAECAKGIYHVGPRTIQPVDVFMQYVEDEKERALKANEVTPCSVALVGFRDNRATAEIIETLGEAGITVTGCVLPRMSSERMRRALSAEALVFNPSVVHSPLYKRVFGDLDRKKLEPVGPWGFARSRDWFEQVAEAVGVAGKMREVLARREARVAEVKRDLAARAQRHALGFVVVPSSVSRLFDPLSITGLPIVPVVREFGFSVRIAVYGGAKSQYLKACSALEAALSGLEGVEVIGFESPQELDEFLRDPSLAAVFTEFFYDHRLSRRGKGSFSAREFEMGLEGAVRSLRRLVNIAELPFYRAYSRYLCSSSDEWWNA